MPFSEDNLSLLGYFELLDLIAGYSQSALGRTAITAMRPSNELPVIRAHRGLYGDLLRLREESRSLPGLHFENLGEVLHAVRPQDAMLDPAQLLACRAQLEVAAEVAARVPDAVFYTTVLLCLSINRFLLAGFFIHQVLQSADADEYIFFHPSLIFLSPVHCF